MSTIAIVYTTTTGNTRFAAELLQHELGANQAELLELTATEPSRLEQYNNIICCVSTWGRSEMQDDWEALAPHFRLLNLKARKVAILGMGDQKNYPAAFADGVGKMAKLLRDMGLTLVGKTSTEGYTFSASKAVESGQFLGLIIDEDNQHDLTMPRVRAWARQLKKEFA